MDEDSLNLEAVSPVDRRIKQSREIALWFFGLSIFLMLISIAVATSNGSSSTSAVDEFFSSTDSENTDTNSWDSSWVPAGYTVWGADSNIAWKWTPESDYQCDTYTCISAQFISKEGCPTGLYVALNWTDSNDVVISYDNATLPSLLPMQTAKLRFDDVQDMGEYGQIAEINCR